MGLALGGWFTRVREAFCFGRMRTPIFPRCNGRRMLLIQCGRAALRGAWKKMFWSV